MPTRRQFIAAASGSVAAGLAGCSFVRSDDPPEVEVRDYVLRDESWPSFNGHAANTAYSPDGTAVESEPSAAWRAPVDFSDGYPVVGPQLVFYPDGNVLRVFDVADGAERWSRTVYELREDDNKYEVGVTTPPALLYPRVDAFDSPRLVVVGVAGERNELRAYTVEGDLAWRTPTPAGGTLVGAPAYEPRTNRVCVGTTAERVVGVDAPTGEVAWSRRVFGAVETAPAVDEESVVVTTTAGEVYGLATDDGRGLWRVSLDTSTHCTPTMAGDLTFVFDDAGRLYGLEGSSGVAWSNDVGDAAIIHPGLATDGERVYFLTNADRGGEFVAADVRTGERQLSFRTGGAAGGNLPAVVDDAVYTTGVDNLAAFHIGDVGIVGDRERWRWRPDGSVTGPVVAADGRLFFVVSNTEQHELVALE